MLTDIEYDVNVSVINPAGNFGAPSVSVNSKVQGNLQDITLNISSLNVASNEIKGDVSANLSGKKPTIKASLSSALIDLQKFNEVKKADNSFLMISSANAADFVPATPLDLSALKLINANVSLNVAKLIMNHELHHGLKY